MIDASTAAERSRALSKKGKCVMADATQPSESKALRLARYLREIVGLRTTTVYDVTNYESVLWFGDMPQEPECRSPAWNPGDHPGDRGDTWLVVHKQQFPKQPAPPESLAPWIDHRALASAGAEMPALRPARLEPDPDSSGEEPRLVERRLEECPEVIAAYEHYRPAWEKWSREYRRLSRVQAVYAELFRMHTQMGKQGEILELVLGFGLLAWRRPGGSPSILRHMVTAMVDLHFDPATGTIRLDCGVDGAKLKIEDDMLDARLRPAPGHHAAVTEQLSAIGDDVWNRRLVSALKSWAGALHPDSEWSSDLKLATAGDDKPMVTLAPALIMRKRTQAGMVRVYDAVIDRLRADPAGAPPGWLDLVGESDQGRREPPVEPPAAAPPPEIYFPLPANREQRRIVDAIDRHRGVLVQGPPGTGKSHTIANLVCHLLASGKRVLITAETARALKVVKEKLPDEIRPLCVSLLGDGGDALAELNSVVQGITTRFASWHDGAYDERMADVDREIDARRQLLGQIDSELRRLREEETLSHVLGDGTYSGSASRIAEQVAAGRDRFGWLQLPDRAEAAADDPPVSGDDMVTWLGIRRTYDNDAVAGAKLRVVGSDQLPASGEFAAAVAAENEAIAALDGVAATRAHPAYAAVAALTADDRQALADKLRQLKASREILQRRGDSRLQAALRGALEGRQAGWQALLDHSRHAVGEIDQLMQRLGSRTVSLPETWDLKQVRTDVVSVYRHLREGGRWIEFGLYTPKAVKGRTYLRGAIKVDGVVADTPDRLRIVCDYIDLVLALRSLDLAWVDHGGLPSASGTQLRVRAAAIKEHINFFAGALAYAQTCVHVGRILGTTTPPIPIPDWLNGEADAFLDLISAAALEDRLRAARERVTACLRHLKSARDLHGMHPIIGAMVNAVERRDIAAYSHAYQHVQRLEEARRNLELAGAIEARFAPAIPGLVDAIAASLADPVWDNRLAGWERAWRFALAERWLARRADETYRDELWQRRREADDDIRRLLAEAASLRAWTHFCRRLSPPEAAALRAWRDAILSMGKDTDRAAREELRRQARQYIERCRDAIPVWIMPRYLVAEMIDPTPERYDHVIIDEASQLGVDSLFLFYIAKKMIVVGDDQQISPYGLEIADQSVADMQHRYLRGIPFHNAFSAHSSLYGNAKIRFEQNVVLREHFRCMPEIIRFSDDLCYAVNGTPLDPLRMYTANRLQPLVVRHVAGGCTAGEDATNEPEADAVVAQVMSCIADPRYAGRSMGVISLQGDAQARLIEHKLLQSLEPETFVHRRLMCGDAYAFQGDERHIIFLSMVAAPGEGNVAALSAEQARQRFNVAASRAQDQLFLFSSVTLEDLNPACLRHRLLNYMLNPGRPAARDTRRRFDSQFERDVCQVIAERGFQVRTQVCVGDPTTHRYRIDLVVEGMQGRLAVECEGDGWQGRERYDADVARQRDLERAGWEFVRLRGSEFYRDRHKATEPLWNALDRLGIRPGGIDDAAEEPPSPLDDADQDDMPGDEIVAVGRAVIDPPGGAAASITPAPVSAALVEALNGQNDDVEDPASAATAASRRRGARRASS
jgi:very-short-patch-repair endonuclease